MTADTDVWLYGTSDTYRYNGSVWTAHTPLQRQRAMVGGSHDSLGQRRHQHDSLQRHRLVAELVGTRPRWRCVSAMARGRAGADGVLNL